MASSLSVTLAALFSFTAIATAHGQTVATTQSATVSVATASPGQALPAADVPGAQSSVAAGASLLASPGATPPSASGEVSQPSPAIADLVGAAPVKPAAPKPPETTLAIDIDLTNQKMTIKERGSVVGSWPISSGRDGFRTPTGTFRPMWQSRMWYSRKYDNAPMPHAVFFNGGIAMHATQSVGMLGRSASHGCIRQSPANAARTYALVSKHGYAHTRIVVRGKPRDAAPAIASFDRSRSGTTRGATRSSARYDSGSAYQSGARSALPPGTRRVVIVDSWGNRRVGLIAANDPRLGEARRSAYRGGYGGYGGYGYGAW